MFLNVVFVYRSAEYVITMPNMYARGILFGKMVQELGDTCTAKNEQTGLSCDLEFKTKVTDTYRLNFLFAIDITQGFFSGIYNALAGRVRRNHSDVGEISGRWDQVMEFRSTKVCELSCSEKRHTLIIL